MRHSFVNPPSRYGLAKLRRLGRRQHVGPVSAPDVFRQGVEPRQRRRHHGAPDFIRKHSLPLAGAVSGANDLIQENRSFPVDSRERAVRLSQLSGSESLR